MAKGGYFPLESVICQFAIYGEFEGVESFGTGHINNTYRITRPEHNLDRSRTQISLIKSMDGKWEEALRIATVLCTKYR
jgi:hypothetical protein